jgi:hypothetical protein
MCNIKIQKHHTKVYTEKKFVLCTTIQRKDIVDIFCKYKHVGSMIYHYIFSLHVPVSVANGTRMEQSNTQNKLLYCIL